MGRTRIIHELTLDKIAAVDFPCQEGAVATITKRARTGDWQNREEERNEMGCEDFTAKVAFVRKRDGLSRTEALSAAALEFPDELVAYRKAASPDLDAPDQDALARQQARQVYHDRVRAVAASRGIPRHIAMAKVSSEQPDLHAQAFG